MEGNGLKVNTWVMVGKELKVNLEVTMFKVNQWIMVGKGLKVNL